MANFCLLVQQVTHDLLEHLAQVLHVQIGSMLLLVLLRRRHHLPVMERRYMEQWI
jgi:hypothetical protein